MTDPKLEQVTKVPRSVMEDSEDGLITSHYFVQAGPNLYGLSVGAVPAPLPPTPQEWAGLPYLKTYCKTCHSAPQGASGGLRLLGDNDAPLLEILKSKRAAIIERINLSKPDARAMPPYAPLPSDGEKQTFQDALDGL